MVIIRTTLQDLESRAGIGVTGGGTKIPIKDVIRMGAHANHHLAVFDEATGAALNYFRARRTASPAQRIMLIARDGGCTKPCCTKGFYYCQAHHAKRAFADGGHTNVDDLTLACGWDNRSVEDGGYTTTVGPGGVVEWHPPPELDHGQARVNYYHRPELLSDPDMVPDTGFDVHDLDDEWAGSYYTDTRFDDPGDNFDEAAVIAANADILRWTEPWDPWKVPDEESYDTPTRGP